MVPTKRNNSQLIFSLLLPSWLSGMIAIIIGLAIFVGPLLLLHYGSTTQQGIIGLNAAYQHSSLTVIEQAVSSHFLGNQLVGRIVFIAFWGAVGLVVYLLVAGIFRQIKDIVALVEQLGYVHAVRHQLIRYHIMRGLLRIVAVIAWCLLLPLLIYRLIPYGIAAAHTSTINSSSINNWLLSLLFCLGCMLAIHALTVFLRLMVLRPRLFGSSSVIYEE